MRLQNVYTTEVVSCGIVPRTIGMARRFINIWLATPKSGPQSKVIIMTENLPSTKAPSICSKNNDELKLNSTEEKKPLKNSNC